MGESTKRAMLRLIVGKVSAEYQLKLLHCPIRSAAPLKGITLGCTGTSRAMLTLHYGTAAKKQCV